MTLQRLSVLGLFQILCLLGLSPAYAQQSTPSQARAERINYLGIGSAVSLSDEGETALGDGGFSIVGRTSLTETKTSQSTQPQFWQAMGSSPLR